MEGIAAIAMADGKVRPERECAIEVDQCCLSFFLPQLNDSEKANCVEVIRIGHDDLLASLLGLSDFARLIVGNGALVCLRQNDRRLVHFETGRAFAEAMSYPAMIGTLESIASSRGGNRRIIECAALERQLDRGTQAAARPVGESEFAAMGLHDGLCDGQP